VSNIVISNLQIRKLRLGEAQELVQGHTASKGGNGILGQVCQTPDSLLLTKCQSVTIPINPFLGMAISFAGGMLQYSYLTFLSVVGAITGE